MFQKIVVAFVTLSICCWSARASADDCETVGPIQTHELALFSTLLTKIHGCAEADGRAAYEESLVARDRMTEREALLVKICPADNARLIYVQHTLKNLTVFWRGASKGCEPGGGQPPRAQSSPPTAPATASTQAFDADEWLNRSQDAIQRERIGDFSRAAEDNEALARMDRDNAASFWADACRTRAAAGQIEQARTNCAASFAGTANNQLAYEASGIIDLKTGDFDKAVADFSRSNSLFALYGRGLAKLKKGDVAGGNADIDKAATSKPEIAGDFARFGLRPDPASISGPQLCSENPAGQAARDLAMIPDCAVVYCGSRADALVRKNLKHIDDMLADLGLRVADVAASTQKFSRACRALGGDLTQTGPKMDAFRSASYTLSVSRGSLDRLYEAMQQAPDEDIIYNTASDMARVFKQQACMSQINSRTVDGLNAAQDALEKGQIDCAPGQRQE